jgi:hypothetical protein
MFILRHRSPVATLGGVLLLILMASAGQTTAQAQQTQGQQDQEQTTPDQQDEGQATAPIPAYRSPLASQAGADSDEETQPLVPDTLPLSGVQNLTVGSFENNHSYWQPRVDITGTFDSNPQESPNGSGWGTWASFSGGVDVHQISGNSQLTLTYLGGGMISSEGNVPDGVIQQLGVVDKLSFRRWTLSFLDNLNYLPQASFGFGGLGDLGSSTGGSVGLGTAFGAPGQTILTGIGQNIANAFAVEADVNLTPRASLTFVGGYSLLHYSDSDLLNSSDASFRGGYNYQLTRKDTVAVLYTFTAFRYSNFNQSIDDHTIQASYARRVTGRLAFQIAAGPEIALSRLPITAGTTSGGSGSGTSTAGSSENLYWSLNTNLQYQLRRTGIGLSYVHGVNAGSGVLGGSVGDVVSGSVTRQMSRTFSSGVTAGYSRSNGLAITSTTPTNQIYDYWFAGATFSHPLGRTLGLTFSYQMQYQNANSSFCIGTVCGMNVMRNLISIGVGWHERPLLF